jgi:hypothetical protein
MQKLMVLCLLSIIYHTWLKYDEKRFNLNKNVFRVEDHLQFFSVTDALSESGALYKIFYL